MNGFFKMIENGKNNHILDICVKNLPIKLRNGVSLVSTGNEKVKDFMNSNDPSWNTPLIWRTFSKESALEYWQRIFLMKTWKIVTFDRDRVKSIQ